MDGATSSNNPILDENTILVAPFVGESHICPKRYASSSSLKFTGTSFYFTRENLYLGCKALLVPPTPEEAREIFFNGCRDGYNFIKSRSESNFIKTHL